LRQRLWQHLDALGGVYLNGHLDQRLPGNLNLSIAGVDGQALFLGLRPVMAVSSGSACASAKPSPSHVLMALGRSPELAAASIRFGLGRLTTAAEIDEAAQQVVTTVQSLRQLSQSSSLRT